ncbi:MAG TPA: hypothetical protein ENK57_11795 [Polyangiaceae bacterium]|nr:hypothetical protein [Polyangiaceae bacterium]
MFLLAFVAADGAVAQTTCFRSSGAADRAQALVGLHDTVQLSTSCEYALTTNGPFAEPGDLAGRAVDFLELHQHLTQSGQTAAGDPRVIYARTGRAAAARQTLMLRYCAHYLLEEQLGFRVIPAAGSGGLRVERVRPPQCDAERLELRVVQGVSGTQLHGVTPTHTLPTGTASLMLPQGDWSIYAARPGSAVGLRVGVFRTQRVVTPLQNYLRSAGSGQPGTPPLLAARWPANGPGMLLGPTEEALSRDLLWPEMRTAADAGVLWLARRGEGERPVVIGVLQLESGEPAQVRLPDTAVSDTMRAIYDEAGRVLAPTDQDWRAVFQDLSVCLAPSYHEPHAVTIGGLVPDGSPCASIGQMSVLSQVAGAAPGGAARVCLRHGVQRMTTEGARQELAEQPDCLALPEPGSNAPTPFRVAVAGDRMTLEGQGLCVLVDGSPLEPVEGEGDYVLRAGLLEVRQGGGTGCASPQSIARLRLPVFDPEHEWHPVGLYAGASDDRMSCEAGVCPWAALLHDETDVYAYIESRQELEFRLSTTSNVAAVMSGLGGGSRQLTQDVTLLSGLSGAIEGASAPALVSYLSRDDACPTATVEELSQQVPVDPDSLLADATFNLFLLAVDTPDRPPVCLAHARFRARPSRAFVAETVGDVLGLELGLLGDTQAVFFANDPVAMGLMLPVAWFRLTPGIRFISLEIALNVVMAAAFPSGPVGAEVSRLGGSLSWGISFGIPEYLPRILTVGGMLHAAAETSSIQDPIVSFYVGLNLATLVDLAGGR